MTDRMSADPPDPHLLKEPMETFHAELQEPLVAALVEHGEPRPQLVAETIEGALIHVARGLGSPPEAPLDKDEALAVLLRIFGGYLGFD